MNATMNARNQLNLGSQGPQDPAHLARTLRRIKRRLLLEQCGVALPESLQNVPSSLPRPVLSRPSSGALPYALPSKPQVLVRSDSGDSTECSTIKIGSIDIRKTSVVRPVILFTEVNPASPSKE